MVQLGIIRGNFREKVKILKMHYIRHHKMTILSNPKTQFNALYLDKIRIP